MESPRFRPSVTSLESREVPTVTPEQVFAAAAEAEESRVFLQRLLEKDLATLNVYTIDYLQDFLPTLSNNSLQSAETLALYQNELNEQIAVNPSLAGLQAQVAEIRYKAEVNALWGYAITERVGGVPLGTVRTPVAPNQPIPATVDGRVFFPAPVPPPVTPDPENPENPDTPGEAPDPNDPSFVAVGSEGLRVREVTTGTGTVAEAGNDVRVNYTGWRATDGFRFETTIGSSPTVFNLNQVIQGFNQGIQGMQVGGTRQIFIPSSLGYGEVGSGQNIPPNTDLIFEVELLEVGVAGSLS
jgi:FKBP-type peptidyl-prolyl cis-trans isomerase FkpA